MPKKFAGENSKAVVARARKAAVHDEQKKQREKAIEDEYWKDDDKQILKKQQKKDEKEKKKQEQIEKKLHNKLLLESEMDSIKVTAKVVQPKLTRSQIMTQTESKLSVDKTKKDGIEEEPLLENLNHLSFEGEEARTVDEAINILCMKEKVIDKHPEKRLKAAYAVFEKDNLPKLKEQNPTLRLSQIKQLLKKEWMKSPANPVNNL